uniref:Sulfotransferase n=1 Tax=Phallusia mammillata TaxID=59560 RepID=A0A6F9DA48_9ASCI|nr:carbohydrate sulfotransferase 3 [Phallusia mammillata]
MRWKPLCMLQGFACIAVFMFLLVFWLSSEAKSSQNLYKQLRQRRNFELLTVNERLFVEKNQNFVVPKQQVIPANSFVNEKVQTKVAVVPVQNVEEVPKASNQREALLILTSMRTGSSFTGQFFNQHPDVFYIFEPLFPFHDSCKIAVEKKIEVLEGLINCNFTALKFSVDESLYNAQQLLKVEQSASNLDHLKRRIKNLQTCKQSTICFRQSTKALCGKDFCPHAPSCSKCKTVPTMTQIERKCQEAKLVVIKSVRTCHVDWLSKTYSRTGIPVKILHLVRDPRATGLSRLTMHKGLGNATHEMLGNCQIDAKNMETRQAVAIKNDHWLTKRYMLARYEDILSNVAQFLDDVTEFLTRDSSVLKSASFNLTHPEVTKWFKTNSRTSGASIYSTSRNISKQASKWRKTIQPSLAFSIQKACEHMMSLFGYKPLKRPADLLDWSISLLSPLSKTV